MIWFKVEMILEQFTMHINLYPLLFKIWPRKILMANKIGIHMYGNEWVLRALSLRLMVQMCCFLTSNLVFGVKFKMIACVIIVQLDKGCICRNAPV